MNLKEALLLVLIIFGCSLASVLLLAVFVGLWRHGSRTERLGLATMLLLFAVGIIWGR